MGHTRGTPLPLVFGGDPIRVAKVIRKIIGSSRPGFRYPVGRDEPMIEQRNGKIINISSVLGRMGTPFNGAYVSSKFALEGMSESLRAELSPFGVHVSLVEPGLFPFSQSRAFQSRN